MCQKLSFAEHSREEGVSVLAGREGAPGSLPLRAVCGGAAGLWPSLAAVLPQEEETKLCVLTFALLSGCDDGVGHVCRMCVQRAVGQGQSLIWECVEQESPSLSLLDPQGSVHTRGMPRIQFSGWFRRGDICLKFPGL